MQSRERGFLSVSKEASWHQNVFYVNRGSQMGHFHLLSLFLSGLFVYLRNFHVLHVLLVPSHPWNQFKQKTQKSEIYRKSQIGWIAQQFTCGKWSGKWDFISATTSRNQIISLQSRGSENPNTGPIRDRSSFGSNRVTGAFAHIDASAPRRPQDKARLVSSEFQATDPDNPLCLRYVI